jgi:hypothetical protein
MEDGMNAKLVTIMMMLTGLMAIAGDCQAQTTQQHGTLAVKGYPGTAPLIQVDGRSYVNVTTLAQLTEGTLSYSGDQVTLTFPSMPEGAAPAKQGFSKQFLQAGIEAMSVVREWRIAIVNAVQNNYPISEDSVAAQQRLAERNLRLASTAASTDDDRSAVPLLTAEFKNMQKLSDRILAKRRKATYISPKSLNNDPLDQQILSCAQSLETMAANNAFQDTSACHEFRN